jgi:hypothetical protein
MNRLMSAHHAAQYRRIGPDMRDHGITYGDEPKSAGAMPDRSTSTQDGLHFDSCQELLESFDFSAWPPRNRDSCWAAIQQALEVIAGHDGLQHLRDCHMRVNFGKLA